MLRQTEAEIRHWEFCLVDLLVPDHSKPESWSKVFHINLQLKRTGLALWGFISNISLCIELSQLGIYDLLNPILLKLLPTCSVA